MHSKPAPDEQGNAVIRTYENNGLLYGGLFGVLLGVLISGPHFNAWPLWSIMGASAVCALIFGLICHLVMPLMFATLTTAPGQSEESDQSESDDHARYVVDD